MKTIHKNSINETNNLDSNSLQSDPSCQKSRVYENVLINRVAKWSYDHPIAAKITLIALTILSVALLAATVLCPFLLSGSTALVVSLSVGTGISGLLLLVASRAAGIAHRWLMPSRHDMKNHVYGDTERVYKTDNVNAKLSYPTNDIPVLEIEATSHNDSGFAQGYLLGKELLYVLKKWNRYLKLHPAFPNEKEIPKLHEQFLKVIPKEYVEEMNGMVDGYNTKMKELKRKERLTFNQCLLLHLIPENHHFNPKMIEKQLHSKNRTPKSRPAKTLLPATGCTVFIARDESTDSKDIIFARNMDWPALDVAGKYSLVVKRKVVTKNQNKGDVLKTMDVTVPGLLGIGTGMNSAGLCLSMNICKGKTAEVRGMPAMFYNRKILEQCSTVEKVSEFVKNRSPLGPYHMSVADKDGATAFHMYQNDDDNHYHRSLDDGERRTITVSNCRYSEKKGAYDHHFASEKRESNIDKYLAKESVVNRESITNTMKLPLTNNFLTIHHVVMHPKNKYLEAAFDNGFAGETKLQRVEA